jgi:hypothetical protein
MPATHAFYFSPYLQLIFASYNNVKKWNVPMYFYNLKNPFINTAASLREILPAVNAVLKNYKDISTGY